MAQHNGNSNWVKINRSIFSNFLWVDSEPFCKRAAWIDLILLANHEDGEMLSSKGDLIKIPRGSHFTSIRNLSTRWNWSCNKVRRFLGTLVSTGMITVSSTGSGTLLSLVKYDDFQGERHNREYNHEYDREHDHGYDHEYNRGYDLGTQTRIEEENKKEKEGEEPPLPEEWGVDEEEVDEQYDETGSDPDPGYDRGQLELSKNTPRSRVEQLRDILHGLGTIPG